MRRFFAFLLAGAMCCGLLATALALTDASPDQGTIVAEGAAVSGGAASADAAASGGATTPDEVTEGEAAEEASAVPAPDAVGALSFANLEQRVRENNLTMLSLGANISSIDVIDYDQMREDLRKQLNELASQQWQLTLMPNELLSYAGMDEYNRGKTVDQLDQAYDALRETFDDLKDGKLQEDYDAVKRQLENAQNQLLVGAESLYTAILEMKTQRRGLQEQLDALDRTLQELELRYDLGQISALQLQEARNGRTALASGIATLDMNIRNCTLQMEAWIGAKQTGQLSLGEVPEVTGAQIAAMDLEKDLASAKEASYALFDAKRTLDDAEETFHDNNKGSNYQREAARQNWKAAQYTYEASVQNFELNFRTMFAAVADCRQILAAKETALALERANVQAQELKYQQGTISKNALLSARDDLSAAGNAVASARHDLFSAYRAYDWAMRYGVLN